MKMVRKNIFMILVVCLLAISVFTQSEAQMEEDAERVHAIYKEVTSVKDFRIPEGVSKRIGENYPAYQSALDGMSKTRTLRDSHGGFLKSFSEKYAGGETELYKVTRSLNSKFESLSLGYDVGDEYESIMTRFSYLDTAGEKNALTALKHVRDFGTNASTLKALHEIYRVKAIEEAKSLLTIAPLFDPGNERIERRVARLSTEVDTAFKEYKAEEMRVLQSRKFKGNISSTSASSPASLAAAGKRFLNSQSDWGGNTKKQTNIKKVSIIGDWFVAERDALGRPTRYGLPAAIYLSDNTTDPGVVRVYEVSLITKFPKMEPNFYGVWVGKVWRMLDKNLPK